VYLCHYLHGIIIHSLLQIQASFACSFVSPGLFLFRRLKFTECSLNLQTPSVFHSSTKMRWDRTVAIILLIFSITSIALAAPAVVRPTHTGVAEAASEKRVSDDEATYGSASESMPESPSRYLSESTDSDSDRYLSASESLDGSSSSGSSHDDWPPVSPAASFHEGSGAYQFFAYPADYWRYDDESVSNQDSAPESPGGSSHHDPVLASPAGSSHRDSVPELPSSGSMHQDAMPDLQPSGSLHQDAMPDLQPPSGSLHQDAAPDSQPFGSFLQDAIPPSSSIHNDVVPDLQPSGSLHQDSVPGSPLHDTFFNDALKKKLKIYAGLGVIVAVPVGLTIGVQELIKNTRSHGAYVSLLFLPLLSTLTESQTF
jgi:hypothetical protein